MSARAAVLEPRHPPLSPDSRERMILGHIRLADILAREEHRKLPQWITIDEARSAAYLALVRAVDRWDATRGVPLGAYVTLPIRGAVRDLGRGKTRKLSWVPQDDGRYYACEDDSDSIVPRFCPATCDQVDPSPGPESVAAYREFQVAVWRRVERLPVRMQLILRLQYCAGLTHREIGRLLRYHKGQHTVQREHVRALAMLREGAR